MPVFRKQPSVWPKGWLILLRVLQLLSALIVVGIMGFFAYHLRKEGYPIPYEFIALDFVGSVTIFNVLITLLCLCCGSLRPLFVLIFDFLLSLVWGVAFGLLARSLGRTTLESCTEENYGQYPFVCHMFKILVAFSGASWILHLGTAVLAYMVRRKANTHAYQPALNPAVNLMNMGGTAYKPMGGSGEAYAGAHAPPVYSPETAGGVNVHGAKGGNTGYYGA